MKARLLITAIVLALASAGCADVPVIDPQAPKGDTLKENMINANRHLAHSEETQIEAYVARRSCEARRLDNGVRIVETRRGKGAAIDYEDTVSLRYRVEAINGTVVYNSVSDTVVAGHLQPTRGLDAALRTLAAGSTACVILPSEQAYGVAGDGKRVGGRMVLIYTVEVLEVNKKRQ